MGKETVFTILSYIFILIGVIWYLLDKDMQNGFSKFHFKQALNLFVVMFVLGFIIAFAGAIIPGIGLLTFVLYIINIVFIVIQIIAVVGNKQTEVPVIGSFAEKYLTF